MKRSLFTALAVVGLAVVMASKPAHADLFKLTYVDSATDGTLIDTSALLTTDALSGGAYQITGITGTRNGDAITTLDSFSDADNLLYNNPAQYFDTGGLSFDLATGPVSQVNLYSTNGGYLEGANPPYNPVYIGQGTPVTLTITAVPEAQILFGFGSLLGMGGLVILRSRRAR